MNLKKKLTADAICPFDGSKDIWQVVKAVVITTFKEITALAAISVTSAGFVTSPFGVTIIAGGALVTAGINLLMRSIAAATFLFLAEQDPKTQEWQMPEGKAKKFINFVEYIAPLGYAFMHYNTFGTVVHEGGHALAIQAMFEKANSQIKMFPFQGAMTQFTPKTLSTVGNFMGVQKANMIIAAAGPAAAVTMSTIELLLAEKLAQSHPRLSRYLKIMGGMNLTFHLTYAYSALSLVVDPTSGHDFVRLWSGGIHPYVSIVSMIALPIVAKAGMCLLQGI